MIYLGKSPAAMTAYDIVGHSVDFDDFAKTSRTAESKLQSYQFPNKAFIKYDFDFISEADYKALCLLLRNRSTIQNGLFTLPEPYAEDKDDCLLTFAGITAASSTHLARWKDAASAPTPEDGGLTEFDNTQYNALFGNDALSVTISGIANQGHLILSFNVMDFVNEFGYEVLNRMTLALWGLKASPIKIYAWDQAREAWYLLKVADYLNTADFSESDFYLNYQTVAKLYLPWGSQDFLTNYIDGSGRVHFRITYPAGTYPGDIFLQYAALLINGYHVQKMGRESINFRESFIGNGRKGSLDLEEI
jgi:hypothetical protein